MSLEKWMQGKVKEEVNPTQKYPIIWKTTKCEQGECREARTSHRWSIPAGTASGLMVECYDCHKTRIVQTDSNPEVWINKEKSDWVSKRLEQLNNTRR